MKKYIMVKKWEQFKSVLIFMVHPVGISTIHHY